MRKGFTLLELMIVLVIVGVLSTLGIMQYQSAIERSRGAEARQVMGQLRSQCAGIFMQDGATANCTDGNLGIGSGIPGPAVGDCAGTHFFTYSISGQGAAPDDNVVLLATRCTGVNVGKVPQGPAADTLQLTIDYGAGTDDWVSNVGY